MKIRKFKFGFDQNLIERLRIRFLEEFKENRSYYDENDARLVALDDYWIERFLHTHHGKWTRRASMTLVGSLQLVDFANDLD